MIIEKTRPSKKNPPTVGEPLQPRWLGTLCGGQFTACWGEKKQDTELEATPIPIREQDITARKTTSTRRGQHHRV